MENNIPPNEQPTGEGHTESPVIAGVILIGVGLLFLASNLFDISLSGNWWAFFLLIPAGGILVRMWNVYQATNRVPTNDLVGLGFLLVTFAIFILPGLTFGNMWPLYLIVVGAGALLNRE